MTIKGERADNIRKMTPEESRLLRLRGGAVDESIPAEAAQILAGLELDVDALGAFFGPRLARYREGVEDASERLPVAKEIQLAEETCELINELRERVASVPDIVRVGADMALWQRQNQTWFHVEHRLAKELDEAWMALQIGIKEAERFKGRSGAKSQWARDGLAVDTMAEVERLLPRVHGAKTKAARIARDLLKACGIQVPEDLKDFRRLRKEGGKN